MKNRAKGKGVVSRKGATRRFRRRNAPATRQAILDAAKRRFTLENYSQVGLRDIAADVGVDSALVARYFSSKEKLFIEVLVEVFHPEGFMTGDHDDFGARMAAAAMAEDSDQSFRSLEAVLFMLRAAMEPTALKAIKHYHHDRFIKPFASWLGGSESDVRANLIAGMISGIIMSRTVSADKPLSDAKRASYVRRLARALQSFVDDK